MKVMLANHLTVLPSDLRYLHKHDVRFTDVIRWFFSVASLMDAHNFRRLLVLRQLALIQWSAE